MILFKNVYFILKISVYTSFQKEKYTLFNRFVKLCIIISYFKSKLALPFRLKSSLTPFK